MKVGGPKKPKRGGKLWLQVFRRIKQAFKNVIKKTSLQQDPYH